MGGTLKEKASHVWARWGDWNNFLDILDLVGWKTGGWSVVGSVLTSAWFMEPGNRPIIALLAVCVAILIVGISIWYQVKNGGAKQKKVSIEAFTTVDDLRSHHPLSETFELGNEIHAYLLSGEGIFAEHNDNIKRVRRLILPDPSSENVSAIGELASPPINFTKQIQLYRKLAKDNNVPVRQAPYFSGTSLLFCNPEQRDGWVQIGPIIPYSQPYERHHYRLYRSDQEEAFSALYKSFDRLWEKLGENLNKETDPFPVEGFMPIASAARSLYNEFPNRYILERAREEMSPATSDVSLDRRADLLRRIAKHISKNIPIYGENLSTGVFEKIKEIRWYRFEEDLTMLVHQLYDASPGGIYKNAGVRIEEFDAFQEDEGMDESSGEAFRKRPKLADD